MKSVKKTLLYIFIIVLLIFSSVFLFLKTYEKKIKQQVIIEVNKYFVSQLAVSDIRLTVFQNFPNISIVLKNLSAGELPAGSNIKLFTARHVYMTVNLMNFIRKNYVIERISISDIDLNLKIYADGKNNFDIIKKQTTVTPAKKGTFSFDLNKIRMNNLRLKYSDSRQGYNIVTTISRADFKCKFSDKNNFIGVNIKSIVNKLNIRQKEYFNNTGFSLQCDVSMDYSTGIINLTGAKFSLNKASFNISGKVTGFNNKDKTAVDMQIKSNTFNLSDFIKFIPEKYSDKYKDYQYGGEIAFDGKIKGNITSDNLPFIVVNFKLDNGNLIDKNKSVEIKQISFTGSFTNGQYALNRTSVFELSSFSANLSEKNISGYFRLENLDNPYIHLKLKAGMDLKLIHEILKIKGFKEINGNASIDGELKGLLSEISKGKTDNSSLSCNFNIDHVNILPDSSNIAYNNIEGKFSLTGNTLSINGFNCQIAGSDLKFSGIVSNIIPFIFIKNEKININGNLSGSLIDINKIIQQENGNAKAASSSSPVNLKLILPPNTDITLNINCDEIIFEKFIGKNVKGIFKLIDNKIYVENLFFISSGGATVLNGKMEQKGSQFLISGIAEEDNIDISSLFKIFNNFEQNFIVDKNLRGKISGEIKTNIYLGPDMTVDLAKFYAIADLEITHGELVDFKPLMNLMGFVKMKKMKDVQFDKIENILIIKDKKVIIPTMNLRSNAFLISASGEHNFDNTLNYNLKVNLTSLFFGTNKREKKEFSDGEDDQKGGLNLYVVMYGNGDDVKYKFDKRSMRKKFKDNYEEQKKEVKESFKKDQQKKGGENDFDFKWEDQ